MKPTLDIKPEMPNNSDLFDNEFFNRFQLRTAPEPLQLTDEISKDYRFPTFYGDVTCAIGIFMCPYENAARMMLHPKIKPVRMPKGRALVAFSCYIYKNVHEVGTYNEIAMTIPVMVDPGINIPVLPMILPIFSKFGFYVFSMPVTSLENQIRGDKIWGLPKVVQEIDVDDSGENCVTTGMEDDGAEYFKLSIPKAGKKTRFDVRSNLYTRKENELLQSATCFQGDFNVNKNMQLLFNTGVQPDQEYLKIGDTPSGKVLKELEIEPMPFQTRFAVGMSSCFDLPTQGFRAPFKFDDGE